MRKVGVALAVAGVLGASTLAAAAPDETATSARSAPLPRPLPVSFVVSGGVSLGAYQAGFLQTLVAILKQSPEAFDLKLATGASAGSVNSLLALFASCEEIPKDPTGTLMFRSWTELGFPALAEPKFKSPTALFSRTLMGKIWENIRARYEAGFPTSCDVALGVATTRLAAKRELLAPNSPLQLPRSEEKFVVRLRGQGEGKAPKLENYVDSTYEFPQVLLPLADAGSAFDALRDLLYASGAYPFAFEPVKLPHCMSDASKPDAVCSKATAATALFIDGGVFDKIYTVK